MSPSTTARLRAAIAAIAPAVLLAGLLYHPPIGDPIDDDFLARLAAAVVADPARWAVAHLAVAVGSGLLLLAFLGVRGHLREAGEERWSARGVPFIVVGSTMYALLPAMEFAPMSAANAGAGVQAVEAVQAALMSWFRPVLFTAASFFAVGAAGFAAGIVRSGVLAPGRARLVAIALLVTAAARFVPLNFVQMEVHGVAVIVAFWPIAYAMWSAAGARAGRAEELAEP